VARVGGDEFIVALPDLKRSEDATVVADRILAALPEPIEFGDRRLVVGTSIGIALFPDHGDDGEALLRRADAAMYQAKAAGRGCRRTFDPAAEDAPAAPVRVTAERLREALARHELSLAWQPVVALTDRRICAVEALVRWNHPELGELPAAAFLPAAADAGLLLTICEWVTRTACAQARAWDGAGLREVPVVVNLCTRALLEPALPDRLAELLRQTRLAPRRLQLDLTEDAVVAAAENPELLRNLARLRELGVTLNLDDFGTGPTALVALSRVPLHTLKIGRAFGARPRPARDPAALLRAIAALARSIGFREVVVEGVETEAELATARDAGCDAVQGFLVGRPVGAHALAGLLRPAVQ
jgi:predicted signal transduction protein with EAL and GGDEF domain